MDAPWTNDLYAQFPDTTMTQVLCNAYYTYCKSMYCYNVTNAMWSCVTEMLPVITYNTYRQVPNYMYCKFYYVTNVLH